MIGTPVEVWRQPRRPLVGAFAVLVGFDVLLLGFLALGAPEAWRSSHALNLGLAFIALACSTPALIWLLGELIQPTRLIVDGAGLTHRRWRTNAFIPWSDIGDFVAEPYKATWRIGYRRAKAAGPRPKAQAERER